jgi:hypothetical protein
LDLAAIYQGIQESTAPTTFLQPDREQAGPAKDAFNPQAFLSNILRTQSLKELLETDSSMIKEIKDLENNMKALVYANYSKFITASTTIHQMRGKVEGMEDEMKKLAESVEKITGVSDKISGTLQSKREMIEQLSGVHHLLQKLQFLVDLPSRLRTSIAAKHYEEATTYWRKTRHVLEKYKHFSSFTPIETQCTEIIKDLTNMLSTAYFSPKVSYETLSDYAGLLLDLNEPHDKLRIHFVAIRLDQLSELIGEFQNTPMVAAPEPSAHDKTNPVNPDAAAYASVSAMNQKISQPISEFIATFCTLFVSRRQISVEDQFAAIILLDKSMNVLFKHYTRVINAYLSKVIGAAKEASKAVPSDSNPMPSPSSEVLRAASECLDSLLGTYWSTVLLPTTAPKSLLEIKRRTKLGDTASYVNGLISSLLDVSFDEIKGEIVKIISSGREKVTSSISAFTAVSANSEASEATTSDETKLAIDNITNGIVSSLDASFASKLHVLFSLCAPGSFLASSASTLLASVQSKIQQLLQAIVEQFGGTDATRSSESEPLRLLVAPLVFDALKNKALPTLASTLARIISQTKHTDLDTNMAQNGIFEFSSDLSLASHKLLAKHVRDTGVRIGEMLRKAVETSNWLKRPEPHGVDGAIEMVVQELTSLQKPISVLYDQGPRKERKRVLLGSVSGADQKLTITSDVEFDQLFQKKVNYFDKVDFNGRAIATATIKIALKTYLETVRLQTFSTNGYQQLQLDVHYLNLVLDQYVSDPSSLDAMMMDILNSVKERCTQPHSMDLPIIAKLCSEAFAKLNHGAPPSPAPSSTAPSTSSGL